MASGAHDLLGFHDDLWLPWTHQGKQSMVGMGHVPLSDTRETQALSSHQVVPQISVVSSARYGDYHQHGDVPGLF